MVRLIELFSGTDGLYRVASDGVQAFRAQ